MMDDGGWKTHMLLVLQTLGLIGVFPYQALDLGKQEGIYIRAVGWYRLIDFIGIYETLKLTYLTYMEEKTGGTNRQPSVLVLWACGMISGSIGATSVYPLNVSPSFEYNGPCFNLGLYR